MHVLVTFYSTYGHIHRMALAVAEGAESVPDVTVRLRRIPELEEARKAPSAQDAYVRAQQAQADIPAVTHDDLANPSYFVVHRRQRRSRGETLPGQFNRERKHGAGER